MSTPEQHEAHGWYTARVSYHEDVTGSVIVLTCESCAYAVEHCEHTVNKWNDEGTVLTCQRCGADGT